MTPPGEMKGVIYSATRNPLIRPAGTFSRKREKGSSAWRAQHLRRLANPVFTPLDGPSIYPAWRAQYLSRLATPAFTPLGGASVYAA